jgi:hypothetical protein
MSREEWRGIVAGTSVPIETDFTNTRPGPARSDAQVDRRKFFCDLVVFLYGANKPEVLLAEKAACTTRMARLWLDSSSEPSGKAKLLLVGEVVRRLF